MREEDIETTIKVVVVGNGAVGKSSMIKRYCKGVFTEDYKQTIGVDFLERQIVVNAEDVRLMLWDTAGQEEFDAITKAYYRGAQACVLAFSCTDRESIGAVEGWKVKVEREVGTIPSVLVQNKVDLEDTPSATVSSWGGKGSGGSKDAVNAMVEDSRQEGDALAHKLGLTLFRTSVKDDLNVNQVFEHLASSYLAQIDACESATPLQTITSLDGIGGSPTETHTSISGSNSRRDREITLANGHANGGDCGQVDTRSRSSIKEQRKLTSGNRKKKEGKKQRRQQNRGSVIKLNGDADGERCQAKRQAGRGRLLGRDCTIL